MAIEDSVTLVESLTTSASLRAAFADHDARRRPRVQWVQQQSRAVADAWVLAPDIRDRVLRERGDDLLRARYRALIDPG